MAHEAGCVNSRTVCQGRCGAAIAGLYAHETLHHLRCSRTAPDRLFSLRAYRLLV
jgi:hypothetical protein